MSNVVLQNFNFFKFINLKKLKIVTDCIAYIKRKLILITHRNTTKSVLVFLYKWAKMWNNYVKC